MIGKNWNFYVKKMQKFVIVLFGVLWPVILMSGCTKKEEETLMLLNLEEAETGSEALTEPDASMEEIAQSQPEEMAEDMIQESQKVQSDIQEEAPPQFLYVHVCGAVQNPGVYELAYGSRVFEAIELAGGFAEDADMDYVNQAQILSDAAKIVIPTMQETERLSKDEQAAGAYGILTQETPSKNLQNDTAENKDSGLVNINTAGVSELCSLPGIGEAKADAIIAYRTKIGVFASKEQIMEIDGIKSGLYSKIQDKICVE